MTTLYRLVWHDGLARMSGAWCPTRLEAKRWIESNELDKRKCSLERLRIDNSAEGLAKIINDKVFFGEIDDQLASFDTNWKFIRGRTHE